MRSCACRWVGPGLVLLFVVGCESALQEEQTLTLVPSQEQTVHINPANRNRKMRVEVTSSGVPLNVYCFLEKDEAAAEQAVHDNKPSDKILARAEKQERADMEVAVPANERPLILLTPASKNTATVKIRVTLR